MGLPKWLKVVAHVAPQILLLTPLAPIAGAVAAGMAAAEQIPGATGEQKKALVKQIAVIAAQGANAQAGHTVVDPALIESAADNAIDTVVGIANLVDRGQLPGEVVQP